MAQRFAIIEGGTVANVAMAAPDFAAEQGWIAAPDHVGPGWSWDGAAFSLPVVDRGSLDEAKAARKAEVNGLRNARENSIAPTPKGAVQCDLASQSKINGAVLLALLALQSGQPFAVSWTMADNSNVAHSAAEVIAMGQSVGTFVATCHAHGVELKAAIDAAPDFAVLDAIDIAAGWP